MELNYTTIGQRIKKARQNCKYTQEKLAEIVEISPTHMSNIETGATKLSLTTLIKIANALSVTTDELLCDNVIHAKVQFEQDLKTLIDDCNTYELRIIKDLIASLLPSLRRNEKLRK